MHYKFPYRLPNSEAMWVDGCVAEPTVSTVNTACIVELSSTSLIHTKSKFLMIVLITLLRRMNVFWPIAAQADLIWYRNYVRKHNFRI